MAPSNVIEHLDAEVGTVQGFSIVFRLGFKFGYWGVRGFRGFRV